MKKRIIAILCTLALAVGLFTAVAVNVSAAEATIKVGYAREDTNPYARHYLAEGEAGVGDGYTDEEGNTYYYWWTDSAGNTCYELMPVPLRGVGVPLERICAPTLIDDNGDGVVDENDGLSVTSIAISQEGGETVLLVSIDTSYTYNKVVNDAKDAIVEATNGAVSADHIMITCSTTTSGVDVSSYDTSIILPEVDEEDTGSGDTSEDGTTDDSVTDDSGTEDSEIVTDAIYQLHNEDGTSAGTITGQQVYDNLALWYDFFIDQIALSAVNALADQAAATMSKGSIDASEATATEDDPDGVMFNANRHITRVTAEGELFAPSENSATPEYDTETGSMQISEVNDTLSLLQFSFAEEGRKPVVLANWNGVARLNPRESINTYYNVTSDYINCFRNALKDYRVGFYQGAGSNINTTSRISGETSWMTKGIGDQNGDGICTGTELPGNIYGQALAQVALTCLAENMADAASGDIGFVDLTYNATNKSWEDELAYWAARAAVTYHELTDIEVFDTVFSYPTSVTQLEGLYDAIAADAEQLEKLTYYQQNIETTGSYIIASSYHAKDIVANYQETYTTEVPITAFTLGENIAFVTAPGELADRYYGDDVTWEALMEMVKDSETPQQDICNYLSAINLWSNVNSASVGGSYGTPFVLGYCNGSVADIPTKLAYTYNTGSQIAVVGSYEAQTTELAAGSGEAVLDIYADLLSYLATGEGDIHAKFEKCEICGEEVMWREMNQSFNNTVYMEGHYYMTGDVYCYQKPLNDQQLVCFDLNGHTLTGETRAFYVYNDAVLNIQDNSADESGVVQGYGGGIGVGYYGSTLYTEEEGTINFYSGTATQVKDAEHEVLRGGVVSNRGTFNMYGGTITGGAAVSFGGNVYVNYTKKDDGNGGYVYRGGRFNLYGGDIIGGSAASGGNISVQAGCTLNVEGGNITGGTTYEDGNRTGGTIYVNGTNTISQTVVTIKGGTIGGGDAQTGASIYAAANTKLELLGGTVNKGDGVSSCIYTRGTALLKGDIDVDLLYFSRDASLTIEGTYTGTTKLRYTDDLTTGCIIGSSVDADISGAQLTIHGDKYAPLVNGTDLVASQINWPTIVSSDGTETTYNTLDYALLAYKGTDEQIVLNNDSEAILTYTGDVDMDLNGCSLSGAAVSSGTLYCYDSATGDYTVEDDQGYGRITGDNANNVVSSDNSYMTIVEDDGTSFHKYETKLVHVKFRPKQAGLYYGATFCGDEIIKKYVESFGVAVSITAKPEADENGFADHTLYSDFTSDEFVAGNETEYTSTVLINIISDEYGTITNKKNGKTPIYGRSYIKFADGLIDGNYVYSERTGYCSLQNIVEWVNDNWNKTENGDPVISDSQKADVLAFYEQFRAVFNAWDIPEIKKAANG